MSRTEPQVDGWLTAQVDGTEGGCRQPALAGNLPAQVDGSTVAKSLIRNEVDGIDGTSPAREACGGRADAVAGGACVARVTREPYLPSTQEKFNGDSDLESCHPVNRCRKPAGNSGNPGVKPMSSNVHTLRPMKKAIRSLINQRANDLGSLLANQHAKPWIYGVVLAAGIDLLDDDAVERLAELITPLTLGDWQQANDAALVSELRRVEMECQRLMGEVDDLKAEVERLRVEAAARGAP